MATTTFGKRVLAPAAVPAPPDRPPVAIDRATRLMSQVPSDDVLARVPLLTAGLLLLIAAIYVAEVRFGVRLLRGRQLSPDTLLAFGAASRALVIDDGDWWRLFLAPLLHASSQHLVGNSIALFAIGFRLEGLIGRGWFALIFALGALGGVTASLLYNPPMAATVGASGAITALLAALFVLSWHHRASDSGRKMRRVALTFGVPALLPLLLGHAKGGVDYHAHMGGAIVGVALAFVLQALWGADRIRPSHDSTAGLAAFALLGASVASAGAIVSHFPLHAIQAAGPVAVVRPVIFGPSKPVGVSPENPRAVARDRTEPSARSAEAGNRTVGRSR